MQVSEQHFRSISGPSSLQGEVSTGVHPGITRAKSFCKMRFGPFWLHGIPFLKALRQFFSKSWGPSGSLSEVRLGAIKNKPCRTVTQHWSSRAAKPRKLACARSAPVRERRVLDFGLYAGVAYLGFVSGAFSQFRSRAATRQKRYRTFFVGQVQGCRAVDAHVLGRCLFSGQIASGMRSAILGTVSSGRT